MRDLGRATLASLLGHPADATARTLLRAGMAPTAKLLEPLVSVMQAEGHPVGALGAAFLDMAERRRATYAAIAARIADEVPDARMLKGAAIAGWYPQGIVRGCVDLDVYLPAASLWRAAANVLKGSPESELTVTVRRTTSRTDVFLGLTWPSPESAFDSVYRVEFATVAFLGDGVTVPVRHGLPDDDRLAQLLLVAEELFQRQLIARDVVDAAAIITGGAFTPASLAVAAADWRLAPEMLRLAEAVRARDLADPTLAEALVHGLREPAAAEADLRQRRTPPLGLEYGVELDRTATAPIPEFHQHEFGTIMVSPVGSYLLTTDPELDEDRYTRACAAIGAEPALGEAAP